MIININEILHTRFFGLEGEALPYTQEPFTSAVFEKLKNDYELNIINDGGIWTVGIEELGIESTGASIAVVLCEVALQVCDVEEYNENN